MKVKDLLKEVFDFNLFKRNLQNAITTIQSETQNVQANMTEKDEAIKKKEQEKEALKAQLKTLTQRGATQAKRPAPIDSGVGITKSVNTKQQ